MYHSTLSTYSILQQRPGQHLSYIILKHILLLYVYSYITKIKPIQSFQETTIKSPKKLFLNKKEKKKKTYRLYILGCIMRSNESDVIIIVINKNIIISGIFMSSNNTTNINRS
jgi:hypothetical protein